MKYTRLSIPDMVLMEPKVFRDQRGFFLETFRRNEFEDMTGYGDFVQENHSASVIGTLRGLHYQIEQAQGKLVCVTKGAVFDVGVDLRKNSPFYGKWAGAKLTSGNKHMLWVPPGFAHGFIVLSEWAEFSYKCTDYYAPEYERSIRWDDPDIGVDWPELPGIEVLVSSKDREGASFKDAEVYE